MKERIISLAVLAAVSFGIAPAFAQQSANDASTVSGDSVIADCMIQQKRKCYKRVYKKCPQKVAPKVIIKKVVETKTIEKPAVVQQEPAPQAVCEPPAQIVQAAAPVCQEQPVIIQRFEKRHRSLVHLGLFPFNLFGQ
jgi:hypothetical protein